MKNESHNWKGKSEMNTDLFGGEMVAEHGGSAGELVMGGHGGQADYDGAIHLPVPGKNGVRGAAADESRERVCLPGQYAPALQAGHDAGFLRGVTVGAFVGFVNLEGKTCTLRVLDPASRKCGSLSIREGRVVDAAVEQLHGLEAARKILCWLRADVSIADFCVEGPDQIRQTTQNLLMMTAYRPDGQFLMKAHVDAAA